ncbi:MAG: response regulator [Deltaproteobacteria bacterium]|nr:response regulator [Deltaproteobacteria bacterium]
MSNTDPGRSAEIPQVLVVDDEKVIREILADFLSMEGFRVATAADGVAALERLDEAPFDMVISDLKMPNMGGLELLENIQANHENVLTVIMTGFGTVETAIEAMKKGAYDYILKPFKVEEVVHIVHRGIEKQRLVSENIRLKEIISLHELSEHLQATLSLGDVIDSLLTTTINNVRCDMAVLSLQDELTEQFVERGQMVHPDAPPGIDAGRLDFDAILRELDEHRVILAQGPSTAGYFVRAPKDLVAFTCIPLVARQRIIGMLAGYSFTAGVRLTEGQRKLLSLLGSRAAAAVENALLYRNLQLTFRQTIQGLARALEAMDKYTAGHSDRVTVYARITAEELGEPPERVELITQAGMLHDIGKLGCHANLNKPGKLTKEEYEIFRSHPSFGKDIVDPISFLRPIIPGVHLHHERWDGQGYPLGLVGDAIPMMARILAVADTYDAMTSNRAYRRALEHAVAVTELNRCAGTQFDPAVVIAFLSAIEKHRADCRMQGVPIPD